jgi:hypothetical protein
LVVDWKTVQLRNMDLDDNALKAFAHAMFKSPSGSVVQIEMARKTASGMCQKAD